MVRKQIFSVVAVLVLSMGALLSGCSDKNVEQPAAATNGEGQGASESLDTTASDYTTVGNTSKGMYAVYFDFDSSTVKSDQAESMEKNAAFLTKNSDLRIRVEGNCDPRGTNEYNLALGERRALSAKKYLVNLGIDASRISTVSWGEEKLLLTGNDESSWSQNRRDDFVIVEN
ncbi:MAG: peptidoglycan-associated lipoprotein Pal [Desulfobulbaceae bacterium]|nr:peptidoglycan-associated lipoprotein Pal [Desulfobulbaceae bacterium]